MTATEEAQLAILGNRFRHDVGTPEHIAGLRHLLAQCDRDIAQETADDLGLPLPDCAHEGWVA